MMVTHGGLFERQEDPAPSTHCNWLSELLHNQGYPSLMSCMVRITEQPRKSCGWIHRIHGDARFEQASSILVSHPYNLRHSTG